MKKFNRYLEKKENYLILDEIKQEIKLILYNNKKITNNKSCKIYKNVKLLTFLFFRETKNIFYRNGFFLPCSPPPLIKYILFFSIYKIYTFFIM